MDDRTTLSLRIRWLAWRAASFVLIVLPIVLAACTEDDGGGGGAPGY